MLMDLLILDIDPELFLKITLDDIDFINSVLGSLLAALNDNTRLVDRDEQFRNLKETEQQFLAILTDVLNGQGAISAVEFPLLRDRIVPIQEHILARITSLENSLNTGEYVSSEPLVSSDELNELLRDL
jgi:hypothetical protein